MNDSLRIVAALLPFLLVLLLVVLLWGPLRRLRERDKASPPGPRQLAWRMAPFGLLSVVLGLWFASREDWINTAYAGTGGVLFGWALVSYARRERRRD